MAKLSNLKVWYGVSKLNKIKKKMAIEVFYANTAADYERYLKLINKHIHIAYERRQTVEEAEDGKHRNRVLTSYTMFLDDKKFKGSLYRLLDYNFLAESNNVSNSERLKIKEALRNKFKLVFEDYKEPNAQIPIEFKDK